MTFLEKRIIVFLDQKLGFYKNTESVTIEMDENYSITLTGNINPDENDGITLEAYGEYKSITEFLQTYKIRRFSQIYSIKPMDIFGHFQNGKAQVYCNAYGNVYWYQMSENNSIIISNDEGFSLQCPLELKEPKKVLQMTLKLVFNE